MTDVRSAVLAALEAELELHKAWFGTEYPKDVTPEGATWTDPKKTVLKLDTYAVDLAIDNAADWANPGLLTALTDYRQRVLAFNQLIDRAMLFQANVELWWDQPAPALLARMEKLTAAVHWAGIGDATNGAAYECLQALLGEVEKEKAAAA